MEHFLEGSAPLRLWQVNTEDNICICYSLHLGWCTNVLTEQFIQRNVPSRHLLNEETLFMSWWRSAIKEVNDWGPSIRDSDDAVDLENNYFPVITLNFNKHTFYYTIGILTLNQIPFICLGILGTRKKCLIILCLGCVVITFVHLSFIWLLCFLCGLK